VIIGLSWHRDLGGDYFVAEYSVSLASCPLETSVHRLALKNSEERQKDDSRAASRPLQEVAFCRHTERPWLKRLGKYMPRA
jgi:hypothetical protein